MEPCKKLAFVLKYIACFNVPYLPQHTSCVRRSLLISSHQPTYKFAHAYL